MDFGAKNNIAKSLNKRSCKVTIYPAHTPAEEILAERPDGIMLSNGPGDPQEFHPEACPGSQDFAYLFDRFIEMMGGNE